MENRLYCPNRNKNRAKLFNSISSDQCRTFSHHKSKCDGNDDLNDASPSRSKNSSKQENYTSKILKRHAIWSKSASQYRKYIKK